MNAVYWQPSVASTGTLLSIGLLCPQRTNVTLFVYDFGAVQYSAEVGCVLLAWQHQKPIFSCNLTKTRLRHKIWVLDVMQNIQVMYHVSTCMEQLEYTVCLRKSLKKPDRYYYCDITSPVHNIY